MPLISDEQLQSMRQLREDNMLFRCDFEEMTFVSDPGGGGGFLEDWQTVDGLTDLPCSAVALNGNEAIAAQQIAPSSNAFVIVPWRYGALIKAKYRVVVRGDIDGVEFVETYGIIYSAVPKTFSVQTTIYARSGAASGGEPRMALARRAAAPAGLGNVAPPSPPGV